MKHAVFLLLFTAASALADVAPVISWPVNVNTPTPCNLALRLGETVTLRPDFGQDISAATNVVLLYQVTNSTLHSVTGSVYNATGGVAEIRFDVAPTNGTYSYDVYVSGSNAVLLRAFGTMVIYEAIDGTAVTVSQAGDGSALAPIIRWTIDPTRMVPQNITLKQGETVFLQPKFSGIDLTGATDVAIRYRPTNATGWHYEAPGSVYDATGGVVRVRWDSSIEGTNNYYRYEILAQDTNAVLLRSYGFLTILPSLTGSATTMPVRLAAAYWAELTNETATLNVSNLFIQGKAISTNGSPDDVSWKASTNDWNTVTGKVNAAALGSAAYSNAADFQPAGTYLTPSATNVFASTDYVAGATAGLVVTGDSRLSDARTPLAHLQPLSSITNAGTAAGHDAGDFATAAQGAKADTALQPSSTNDWTVTGHGGLVATNDARYLAALTNIVTASTNLPAGTLVYNSGILYGGTNDNDGAYVTTNDAKYLASLTNEPLAASTYTAMTNVWGITEDPSGRAGETDNNCTFLLNTNSRVLTMTNSIPIIFYRDGKVLVSSTNITWPAIGTNAGIWYLYYDHATGTQTVTQTAWSLDQIQVATVYWGGGASNALWSIGEETHGFMPWTVHRRFHMTDGSKWATGQDITATNYGTFSMNSGTWFDEDIMHVTPSSNICRVLYRSSNTNTPTFTNPQTQWTVTNGVAFGASGGLMYDNAGTLTLVPTIGGGQYVNYWIYTVPGNLTDYMSVMGRLVNGTLATVTAETPYDLTGLQPYAESVLLYRVTLRNSSPPVVTQITDYRKSGVTGLSYSPTTHASLTGRDAADSHPLSAITGYDTLLTNISVNGITGTVAGGVASVTIAAGGATYTNWLDAASIGVGDESVFPTYQIRTNSNGSMRFLGWDKTVSDSYAGPVVIAPLSTTLTNYFVGYHSTTGTTSMIFRWRNGLTAWTATTSALVSVTGTLTNLDTIVMPVTGLTALTPVEVEISTVNTNSGTSAGYHYLRAWGWTP